MSQSSDTQHPTSSTHIFGIRHHGPGSARSLRRALEDLGPDIVLVEGPPDAADVLPLLAHPDMQPPIALLVYAPAAPRQAVYYPLAMFSPEWQAMRFALERGVPVRFMDLPLRHQLMLEAQDTVEAEQPAEEPGAPEAEANVADIQYPAAEEPLPPPHIDPIGTLALVAGYSDGERWWEHMVEQRRDSAGLFEAVLEAMSALRETAPAPADPIEAQREAWMRRTIRAAQSEGYTRIAIVCGAWHGPALRDLADARADDRLLKGLPNTDVRATWVPWTYGRLTYASGYGAGIESPGWYDHLFGVLSGGGSQAGADIHADVTIRWMTKIAHLLRAEDLDASSAHVIEAVRLAETLSALRGRPLPGLPELSEAAQAVFCFGSDQPMRLIHQRLIVGERLGAVPDETPLAPLQQDLARQQKRLRLPAEASWRDYDFDLRKPNDLERSHLLHRLTLLGVPWGKLQRSGGGKGTFRELWRLEWQPELAVALIEAGVWGNTIADAASAFACDAAARAADLPALTQLVDQALLADLPEAVAQIMGRIADTAAVSSDIAHLMGALPPLANVLRYGNVRKTDVGAIAHVVDGLVTRIAIGLPGACAALNDDAAEALFPHIVGVNGAIGLLQEPAHQEAWHAALRRVTNMQGCHGLIAGRATRMLLDASVMTMEAAAQRLGLALSTVSDPGQAAAWIEGLLKDSGSLLVHDDALWQLVDEWVATLSEAAFTHTLPLLRRTFSTFASPERRALGERARSQSHGGSRLTRAPGGEAAPFDSARAEAALAVVSALLGIAK